jgi:hypothetical protein
VTARATRQNKWLLASRVCQILTPVAPRSLVGRACLATLVCPWSKVWWLVSDRRGLSAGRCGSEAERSPVKPCPAMILF